MKQSVDDRAAMLGEYIVRNKATVRRAAKQFGVSKSTVHKDVAERLRHVNLGLYKEVRDVLAVNKAQRHIRGGMATKRKSEEKGKWARSAVRPARGSGAHFLRGAAGQAVPKGSALLCGQNERFLCSSNIS